MMRTKYMYGAVCMVLAGLSAQANAAPVESQLTVSGGIPSVYDFVKVTGEKVEGNIDLTTTEDQKRMEGEIQVKVTSNDLLSDVNVTMEQAEVTAAPVKEDCVLAVNLGEQVLGPEVKTFKATEIVTEAGLPLKFAITDKAEKPLPAGRYTGAIKLKVSQGLDGGEEAAGGAAAGAPADAPADAPAGDPSASSASAPADAPAPAPAPGPAA